MEPAREPRWSRRSRRCRPRGSSRSGRSARAGCSARVGFRTSSSGAATELPRERSKRPRSCPIRYRTTSGRSATQPAGTCSCTEATLATVRESSSGAPTARQRERRAWRISFRARASSYPGRRSCPTPASFTHSSPPALRTPTELWGTDGTAAHTRRLGIFPDTVNGQPRGIAGVRAAQLGPGRRSPRKRVRPAALARGVSVRFHAGSELSDAQSGPILSSSPRARTRTSRRGIRSTVKSCGPPTDTRRGSWSMQRRGPSWASRATAVLSSRPPGTGSCSARRTRREASHGSATARRAGTRRLLDVNPGYLGSEPRLIARAADHWLLSADDGATGVEPWVLRLSALDEPAPLRGDVDGDRDVDPADGAAYAALYGARVGDETFPPAADLDGDGAITSADHQLWVEEFGAAPIPIFPLLTRSSPAAP